MQRPNGMTKPTPLLATNDREMVLLHYGKEFFECWWECELGQPPVSVNRMYRKGPFGKLMLSSEGVSYLNHLREKLGQSIQSSPFPDIELHVANQAVFDLLLVIGFPTITNKTKNTDEIWKKIDVDGPLKKIQDEICNLVGIPDHRLLSSHVVKLGTGVPWIGFGLRRVMDAIADLAKGEHEQNTTRTRAPKERNRSASMDESRDSSPTGERQSRTRRVESYQFLPRGGHRFREVEPDADRAVALPWELLRTPGGKSVALLPQDERETEVNGNVIQDFLSKLTRNAQGMYGEEAFLFLKSTGEQSRQGINLVRRTAMELGMDSAQAVSYQMSNVVPLAQFILDQLNRGIPKPVELTPVVPPVPPPTIDHSERILLVQQCQSLENGGNHPKRTPEYYANASLEDLRNRAQILRAVEPVPPTQPASTDAPQTSGVLSMTVDRPDLQLRLSQVLSLSDEQILEQVSPDDLKNLLRFVGVEPPARLRRQTLIRFLRNPDEAKAQLQGNAITPTPPPPALVDSPVVTVSQQVEISTVPPKEETTILQSATVVVPQTNVEGEIRQETSPNPPQTVEAMGNGSDEKFELLQAQIGELLRKVNSLETQLSSMDHVLALYADFRQPLPPNVKTCSDVIQFRFPRELKS